MSGMDLSVEQDRRIAAMVEADRQARITDTAAEARVAGRRAAAEEHVAAAVILGYIEMPQIVL